MPRKPKPSGRKLLDKGKPIQTRSINSREKSPSFLIVCEGEKTEPNYFKGFELNITVEVIGAGFNTETLVSHTQKIRTKAEKDKRPYSDIWVVFDRDSFPADDFQNAITKAQQAGFGVAYSNESFELWYILHFDYMSSGVPRTQYQQMLSERLNKPYKKNDLTLYARLKNQQHIAIQNAEKLHNSYEPNHNPVTDNPCTTVYQLVRKLNEHLK